MSHRRILLIMLAAFLPGGCAPRAEPSAEQAAEQPAATVASSQNIDPAVADIPLASIQYQQTAEIPTRLREVRALALGTDDKIYVGGDKAVRIFDPEGKQLGEIGFDAEPRCLAVAPAEDEKAVDRLYVGMQKHVEVWDAGGKRVALWKSPSEKAQLTSLAATDQDVFAADFGNRIVWHYDTSGELKDKIGARDEKRNIRGLVATTPYLDLALGSDGLVYVVNPRYLRIEAYTSRGDLERAWGRGSSELKDFFGCCNPIHIAALPNGGFVTAEKGIHRIKVYSPEGKFECVVAGPQQMKAQAGDLAVDHNGRVLTLDPSSAVVRVFEKRK